MINPPATRGTGIILPRLNKWMWATFLFIFLAIISALGLFLWRSGIQQKIRTSTMNLRQMQKDKQERIRELREEIYERLKERDAMKQGAMEQDAIEQGAMKQDAMKMRVKQHPRPRENRMHKKTHGDRHPLP